MNFKKLIAGSWLLIIILIITVGIRLWRVDSLMTFGGEHAYDLANIKYIAEGHVRLLGPRHGPYNGISDIYLGPFYYYLLAPFILLSKFDPVGSAMAIIVSRVLTVLFVYLICNKLFNKKTAIISAVVAAVSPYWVNSLGPPATPYFILPIVSLLTILLIGVKGKAYLKFFFVGILIGFALQLHYLTTILIPSFLIYFWSNRKRISIKNLPFTILGFLFAISPIIIFELRNKFFITAGILKQLNSSNTYLNPSIIISQIANSMGSIAHNFIGADFLAIFALLILVVFILIIRNGTKLQKEIAPFFISLLILDLLVSSIYSGGFQAHYLATIYPLLFVSFGVAISSLLKFNKFIPILVLIIILPVLLIKNNLFSSNGYTMPPDLTLSKIRDISKIIATTSGAKTFNITSTLDGDSRALPYRYLTEVYGKNPESVENYDKPNSLYVITRDPARAVRENNLFEIASFQPSNVENDWEIAGDIHLIKLTKDNISPESPTKFITIVNPVRSRELWVDQSTNIIKGQIEEVAKRNLNATWLLAYDNLKDQEVLKAFKGLDSSQEIGAFLEVSQNWATDARVSYKISDGDYYRPDKVFLSGYSPQDREKLINKYFEVFHQKFGYYPKSVGAWYIDSYSQKILSKLGVISALTVSDQFNTDAEMVWGKYFSYPYYPSKYNSLEPANDQSNKIPVVNLEWAQRDPVAGYGKEVTASRQSFQANDYLNNLFDHSYFTNLLASYLSNKKTDFVQITIGLEAGQEATNFAEEFSKQLDEISGLSTSGKVKVIKMSDFAKWYLNKYPGISPSHFLEKDSDFWYMSPKFRAALFEKNSHYFLEDLRYYLGDPQRDYFYKDTNKHLQKEVSASIDNLVQGNEIDLGPVKDIRIEEKFDRLIITSGSNIFEINTNGVSSNGKYLIYAPKEKDNQSRLAIIKIVNSILEKLELILNLFKYSKIDNSNIFGFAPDSTKLLGLKGFKPGIYTFDFQTLSKFKSPAQILEKWQPWIQ